MLLASFLERKKKKEEKIKNISTHHNWKEINLESETGVTGLSSQEKENNSRNKENGAQWQGSQASESCKVIEVVLSGLDKPHDSNVRNLFPLSLEAEVHNQDVGMSGRPVSLPDLTAVASLCFQGKFCGGCFYGYVNPSMRVLPL